MRKIAVIGSINMDMVVNTERIPTAGETLTGSDLSYHPGGKGANQAVAAARLGGRVTMFGCVGRDIFGRQLIDNLKMNGVHTEYINQVENISSGLAMIAVAQSDNAIIVIPGANHAVTKEYIEEHLEHILENDIIVLQNEIPFDTIRYVISLCHKAKKYIIYNPAPAMEADKEIVGMVNCLTPNEHEMSLIFPENDLLTSLKAFPQKLVVTLGKEGIKAALTKERILHIPAYKVKVADTTGAGDTLNGAFAYAMSQEMDFEDALRFANGAAALSIQKIGAQGGMPDLESVMQMLKK